MAIIAISALPAATGASGSNQLAVNQAGTTRRLTLDQVFQEGLTQLNIDNLRLDGNTLSTTNANGDLTLAPNGSGIIKTAAKTMIGSTSVAPDGTLHVHTASAGVVTANAAADDLVVENSGNAGISILTPNTAVGHLMFGDPENPNIGLIRYDHNDNNLEFLVNNAQRVAIDANGTLFIGDTANANMTVGLTINQGANDDEALALKSSDVGHVMTALAEADTFGTFTKTTGAAGGLLITGYRDADASNFNALQMLGRLGEAAQTADITSSQGVVNIVGQVTDGGTGITDIAATGNVLAIRNNATTLLLVKGDGALHATNVTGGQLDGVALDYEDDIGLVRVHQRTIYNDMGIAMSKWDATIKTNEDDLKRLGVLSSQGDFTCLQRMNSLLGGAIWQSHVERKELEQAIVETMPAIAARLEEIRAERKLALAN